MRRAQRDARGGLGAVRTFDYRTTDAADLPAASFDAVIDIAGTAPLRALRRLVRRSRHARPRLAARAAGSPGRSVGSCAASCSRSPPGPRIRPLAAAPKPEITRASSPRSPRRAACRPSIERTFAFAEARAALAHVDAGHTVGKVVVAA